MAESKSLIGILLGIVILVADVAWLIVGSSYTYTPWLILGIVIFVSAVIWLAIDAAPMESAKIKSFDQFIFDQ